MSVVAAAAAAADRIDSVIDGEMIHIVQSSAARAKVRARVSMPALAIALACATEHNPAALRSAS